MAIPTVPIEVWALSDYILPNTGQINKQRPIDDIWAKGYDKGQKPSVETWNYLFNMLSRWLQYIYAEQIPNLDSRFLRISNNLSDVIDKAAARNNLSVYSKAEADARYVNTEGDTMTGPLTLPRLNLLASGSDVAYITTTTPSSDVTYLDIVIGDNAGTAGTGITDSIRFRFENSSIGFLTMMELNALSNTTALLKVTGNIQATGDGTISGTLNAGAISTGGSTTTGSLSVGSNTATVAGKNIVRSVNGNNADGAGNVTITIPDDWVKDVRLSADVQLNNTSFVPWSAGRRADAPAGAFICSLADNQTGKIYLEDIDVIWYRYVQKQIGGVWYNVATI